MFQKQVERLNTWVTYQIASLLGFEISKVQALAITVKPPLQRQPLTAITTVEFLANKKVLSTTAHRDDSLGSSLVA
jgi:hypothetical protein